MSLKVERYAEFTTTCDECSNVDQRVLSDDEMNERERRTVSHFAQGRPVLYPPNANWCIIEGQMNRYFCTRQCAELYISRTIKPAILKA